MCIHTCPLTIHKPTELVHDTSTVTEIRSIPYSYKQQFKQLYIPYKTNATEHSLLHVHSCI